jgi:murein L,D-transpeptidase YafK
MRRLARLVALLALVLAAAFWWVRPAPPPPLQPPLTAPVTHILIEKAARRMTVQVADGTRRIYAVALGFAPDGDKERQGDGRTPEGTFRIDRKNDRSAFHLSLGLDYPRPADRARAAAGGYDPGGDIFIHGQPNALPDGMILRGDWTAGCIAVPNALMADLFAATAIGTPVEIRP